MNFHKTAAIATLLLGLAMLLYFGLQDKQDPFWEELDVLLTQEYQTLERSQQELQQLYLEIHPTDSAKSISALALLSEPFLPTMEFSKFRTYFELLKQQRFAIFSGVTGTGVTTLTESLAKLIVPEEDHRMQIICAPQFDLILHHEYIGEKINGVFQRGKLLQLWERCLAHPDETFLLVIDDLDKINPETFFGPDLWRKLDDPRFKVIKGGQEILIPKNFYMIMTTHSGEGSRIELNNEHFKRLGGKHVVAPAFKEMIIYLQAKKWELEQSTSPLSSTAQAQLAALKDIDNIKRHIYFYKKTNDLIEQDFSQSYQLGQWSNIRELYLKENFNGVKEIFINHVNALSKEKDFTTAHLSPVLHAIKTDGKLKNSNPIATTLQVLEEKGFLTEFLVGLTFMLFTALISWYLFRKKLHYINIYTQRVYESTNAFNMGEKTYEQVSQEFIEIKREVDDLVFKRDISYTEAVFFYNFIEDRSKRIELVRSVNESFMTLVDMFLEDGHLEEKEYQRLTHFLDTIRHKISQEDYERYKDKISNLYQQYN